MNKYLLHALLFFGFISVVFSNEIIDYQVIENLVIHSHIAAIPDNSTGLFLYFIEKYFYFFISFFYFWFLAIICWGFIMPLLFLGKAHITAGNYLARAIFTFGIADLLQSLGGAFAQLGQAARVHAFYLLITFLVITFIFFLVAAAPIIQPQQFYKENVYGGADYERHKLILDSKSAIQKKGFLPATFAIVDEEIEYLGINETNDYNAEGELSADIEWFRFGYRVINNNELPLKYGEMVCDITTPEGDNQIFLDYVTNVPQMSYKTTSISNFSEFGRRGINQRKARYFTKSIPLEKVGNFESKKAYSKKFKINCSPIYSHNAVLLQSNDSEFLININNSENSLTIKNNSTKSFKYFDLMCFLDDGSSREMFVEVSNNKSIFVPNQERTFTYRQIRLNGTGGNNYPSVESCNIINTQNNIFPLWSFFWAIVSFPFTNTISFAFISIIFCISILALGSRARP
jgi:hypothetical protein